MTDDDLTKDLDETRRLLYMALAMPRTGRHELVGTLTNALCHHESRIADDESPQDVLSSLIAAVHAHPEVQSEAVTEVWQWIEAINDRDAVRELAKVTRRASGEGVDPGTHSA